MHSRLAALGASAIALLIAAALLAARAQPAGQSVYTPEQLQASYLRHTDSWMGQTIRIRGSITSIMWGQGIVNLYMQVDSPGVPQSMAQAELPPPGTVVHVTLTGHTASLTLRFVMPLVADRWSFLRGVPILGAMLPGPPMPFRFSTGVHLYQARLTQWAGPSCAALWCDDGILLDGRPSA